MPNTVCMEPKETKSKRLSARAMTVRNYEDAHTAFIGCRNNVAEMGPRKLFLVNRKSVSEADNPESASTDTDMFMVEKWVNVKIYVDEGD